ncbi:MAG: helicase-associated domain-containing protein [Anaerolineae bacterium]
MQPLSTLLQDYHIDALREISDHLGVRADRHPVRKDWLVEELRRAILKVARSQDLIQSLSQPERAALAVALEAGDALSLHEMARSLVLTGLIYVEGDSATAARPALSDVLESLVRKGLIVNLTEPTGMSTLRTLSPIHRVALPDEVRAALPKSSLSIPVPDLDVLSPSQAPSHVRAGDFEQFIRELFFTWAELRREPARRLKAGGMGKRDRRRVAETLGRDGKDEEALEWVSEVHELLSTLNLVNGDESTIEAVDSDAVKLFWSATSVSQLRELMVAYAKLDTFLAEDALDPDLVGGYYRGFTTRPIHQIRERVLRTVGECVDLEWVSFSAMMILLTGGEAGSLLLGDRAAETLLTGLHWYGDSYRRELKSRLQTAEYEMLRSILDELCVIGLVDLGYEPSGAQEQPDSEGYPSAFRLTQWARAHFGGVGIAGGFDRQSGQVIVQPDFQILAMGPVPLRILASLEQFAEREKLDESVVTYRITRDAVYWAYQRGESVESLLTYLREASDQPVPQNIVRSLEAWSNQYERIVLRRQVSVLQVTDAELMDRLLEDPELQSCLHPLDDHTAWLYVADAGRAEARLAALEMLAAHSQGPEADLPDSLRWNDGELVPRAPLPSLFVSATVRRFAEADDEHWKLTPQSVQAAVSLGMEPLEIIGTLERMTGATLPEVWERRLKAWGSHYGDGKAAQVRLLCLEREGALRELRQADSKLRRWLRPLPDSDNLAVVEDARWENVVELLASLGVEIEEARWW